MNKNKHTLLITGAIDISSYSTPFVKITDLQERLQQYLHSLEYAITHYSKIDYIVFCENTNYDYDYSELQKKAKENGKIFEVLTFKGDYHTIQQRGKGYGEGEIVKYALEHSELLMQSECFYKLTGRVVLTNFDRIIRSTKQQTVFMFPPVFERRFRFYVKTSFYKVSTQFYKQNLLDAYLDVDDTKNRYLEHVFFDKLKEIPLFSFKTHPVLSGVFGSSGVLYQTPKKKLLRDKLFAYFGFFDNRKTLKQRILLPIVVVLKQLKWMFSPKIIVRTDGGISSQMHQYLLGRLFAEKDYKVAYDLTFFKKNGKDLTGKFDRNFELLNAFPYLEFKTANWPESRVYSRFWRTKSNYFDHTNEDVFLFGLKPPKFLGDYYRTPKVVWTELFPKYFSVNPKLLDEHQVLYDDIRQNKQSVAIHVRMGDLKDFNPAYGHPATPEYFQKAIDYLAEKIEQPYFYFFSDEPEFVEQHLLKNLSVKHPYKVVKHCNTEKSYVDLFLISACTHQITSKGSMGKIGALLSNSQEKIVVLCDDSTEYVWEDIFFNAVYL